MDRKQKERLRFYLRARKRAEKVLAERRETQLQKQDYRNRKEASHEQQERYTEELTALARQSGVLAMAEAAARQRGCSLEQKTSFYIDYGVNTNHLQHAIGLKDQGVLRASHLALSICWEEEGCLREVEIRVHKKGYITFHNSFLPVYPFLWRRYPKILQKMLAWAFRHPRPGGP